MTVFSALKLLAGDKMVISPTRKKIRNQCHLSEKVISAAMIALDKAGWIKLRYGYKGTKKKWYRISFEKKKFLPTGRKTPLRDSQLKSKNDPKGKFPYGSKITPSSSKEEGNATRCPFRGSGIAQEEHPAAKRERELLQQAKKNRELSDKQNGTNSEGSDNHQNHVQNS